MFDDFRGVLTLGEEVKDIGEVTCGDVKVGKRPLKWRSLVMPNSVQVSPNKELDREAEATLILHWLAGSGTMDHGDTHVPGLSLKYRRTWDRTIKKGTCTHCLRYELHAGAAFVPFSQVVF